MDTFVARLVPSRDHPDLEWTAPITVGNDVYIGVRSSLIMPGVSIGNRCIIGAGSTVTRDVPDNSVAIGAGPSSAASTSTSSPCWPIRWDAVPATEKAEAIRGIYGVGSP